VLLFEKSRKNFFSLDHAGCVEVVQADELDDLVDSAA
jgi:hypothetical protein